MNDANNKIVRLTSAEISCLWNTYMSYSMSLNVLIHFLDSYTDPEIGPLLQRNLEVSKKHLQSIEDLLQSEKIIKPVGFPIEKHVVRNAPKLFSDLFYMQFMIHTSKIGMAAHSASIAMVSRKDLRLMYIGFFEEVVELYEAIIDLMLAKGVYIRPPFMAYPEDVDFVGKKSFLKGWFGHSRALLAIEVTNLFHTSLHNEIGKSICIGFAQVTGDEELRSYFVRGKHICAKITKEISSILQESDVPSAMTWDASVTLSTTAPFSNQLMLYMIGILSSIGITAYGAGLSISLRRDIGFMYEKFLAKSLAYGDDGINIMIERQWMEQPPHFPDREKLANGKI